MIEAVPLSERAEYASQAWLAEVRRFLEVRLPGPAGEPFSVAVRLSNPPPHLHEGDQPFGYTIRLGHGRVRVDDFPDDTADQLQFSDYNAALPFAWTVQGTDAQVARCARREYAFLAGERSTRGGTLKDPRVLAALHDLHDHMARRTLNNPDIRHRAKHLGLERHLKALDDVGYTVMENAFTPEFADELRAEAHRNHDNAPPNTGFRATMLLRRGRIWELAVVHPWVLTLAEYLLGRGFLIYQSDTIVKGPGLDTHPGLHADYGASRVAEPFPDYCLEATAMWAIDDFDIPAGPTVIVPGSFRRRRQVPPGTTREGAVPLPLKQGAIAFWHGATWHGSMPRTAPGRRTSLHNAYTRYFMRPLERYDDLDASILHRNPPVFSTLCGVDDPFGKSGDNGPDMERMGYASRAGYGGTAMASSRQ